MGRLFELSDVELSSTLTHRKLHFLTHTNTHTHTHTHTHTMFALQSQIAGAKVVSKVVANKQQRSTVVSAKIAHGKGTL